LFYVRPRTTTWMLNGTLFSYRKLVVQNSIAGGGFAPRSRGSDRDACRTGRRLHVESHMFDVSGLVETDQALGKGFDSIL
jgi:hypothetical protein